MQQIFPSLFLSIPKDTAIAARYVFDQNNFYLHVGNKADELYSGLKLVDAHRKQHRSERAAAMLYLITVFQYLEILPDFQAADALQKRVDWKYALHLPLSNLGLEGLIFCEFRKDLMLHTADMNNLDTLLVRLAALPTRAGKRDICLDAASTVHEVCTYNRLSLVWGAIKEVIGTLAMKNPHWLGQIALPYWYVRYSDQAISPAHLSNPGEQDDLAAAIGRDGLYLINAVAQSKTSDLVNLPQILSLKRVWEAQYIIDPSNITWRQDACAKCTSIVQFWNQQEQ